MLKCCSTATSLRSSVVVVMQIIVAVQALAKVWWDNYAARNSSAVMDIFCGQLRSIVTCQKCGHVSRAFDPFWDLSVRDVIALDFTLLYVHVLCLMVLVWGMNVGAHS